MYNLSTLVFHWSNWKSVSHEAIWSGNLEERPKPETSNGAGSANCDIPVLFGTLEYAKKWYAQSGVGRGNYELNQVVPFPSIHMLKYQPPIWWY